ncbi:hypothetical protein F2P56_016715 [Juglans regia]|uniref:Uncharacterized protein n=1 Tax=Juglans regia TaxID=51240 RepID=A0A834CX77_JUGRE|nr:hypothetical protein F2P56_016714 [Juglans regia]KAF5466821.1 hypothetical protein F2P56_016715 [Juglans regia]KAF5466822.1 hypothetical protein F2P56_016715 [Juglans regia]
MAALQLRPKHRTLHNPSLIHLFSTSSTPPEPTSAEQSPTSGSSDPSESQRSLSSYFSDVKQQQQQQHRPASPFSQRNPTIPAKPSSPLDLSFSKPSEIGSLGQTLKNFDEFRLRSSVSPLSRPNSAHATTPSSESSSQPISFREPYKRYMTERDGENGTNTASGPGEFGGSVFEEYLRQLRSSPEMVQNERRRQQLLAQEVVDNLKLEQSTDPDPVPVPVIGGTGTLPVSVFGKEREQKDTEGEKMAMKTEFVKMEDKETESRIGGVTHKDLR